MFLVLVYVLVHLLVFLFELGVPLVQLFFDLVTLVGLLAVCALVFLQGSVFLQALVGQDLQLVVQIFDPLFEFG